MILSDVKTALSRHYLRIVILQSIKNIKKCVKRVILSALILNHPHHHQSSLTMKDEWNDIAKHMNADKLLTLHRNFR